MSGVTSQAPEGRQDIILVENADQLLGILGIDHRKIADVAMILQDFQGLAQRLLRGQAVVCRGRQVAGDHQGDQGRFEKQVAYLGVINDTDEPVAIINHREAVVAAVGNMLQESIIRGIMANRFDILPHDVPYQDIAGVLQPMSYRHSQ